MAGGAGDSRRPAHSDIRIAYGKSVNPHLTTDRSFEETGRASQRSQYAGLTDFQPVFMVTLKRSLASSPSSSGRSGERPARGACEGPASEAGLPHGGATAPAGC